MTPASKSKAKDKRAFGKEQQKTPSKTLTNTNLGGSIPTSGYNPLLGTFHTLDTSPVSSAPPLQINIRFRNIDVTEDQNHLGGSGCEYDSVSNNGSWSGESEEHKDRTSHFHSRQETIIPGTDSDKREKIRQKNERKHQRQKEKRAQELHERCSGYLITRKLESLAQTLVGMGFQSERATMALILNEGRLEESVAWLLDEDNNNRSEHNLESGAYLKIDISKELGLIADMETKFKCSKQDVERAIVACEGDLEQAAITLRAQKPEESGDPPTFSSKAPVMAPPASQNLLRPQPKPSLSTGNTNIVEKIDGKDFNYTKMSPTVGLGGMKNVQLLKKNQPKLDRENQHPIPVPPAAEKRWPVAVSSPSVSYPLASHFQGSVPVAKAEVVNEVKNFQQYSKQIRTVGLSGSSSSLSIAASDWHPNDVESVPVPVPIMNSNYNPTTSTSISARRDSHVNGNINQLYYDQIRFQQQQQTNPQPQLQRYLSSNGRVNQGNTTGVISPPSTTLSAASSLGLFTGFGSNGLSSLSSPVDWNAGGSTLLHLDYANIDWSLDRAPSRSRQSMMWHHQQKQSNNGVSVDGVAVGSETSSPGGGGSREWSSPFEENDLFSFPRHFVLLPLCREDKPNRTEVHTSYPARGKSLSII